MNAAAVGLLWLCSGLTGLAVNGLGWTALGWTALDSNCTRGFAQETSSELLIGVERLSQAFRDSARVLSPSVVTISSLVERRSIRLGGLPSDLLGMLPDDLLRELEGREYEGRQPSPATVPEKIQTGVGSGIIVSEDGYILTNNHVIAEADELQIELDDGRTFEATIVGTDELSDVAVLKIEAQGLPTARLGDSSRVQVGDWVIAVGSPFGLDHTVTAGIISATNRQREITSFEDFLQTDAAINPGNSGGPLANLRGEVIGINTAINSKTGTSTGVGFAIPINMASRIMEDLRQHGQVVRGFIGATLMDLTSENADRYQMPTNVRRGAIITGVMEGGPAAQGELLAGDVVTAVGERSIRNLDQFRSLVAMSRPGTELNLHIYRAGEARTLVLTVGAKTDQEMSVISGRATLEDLGLQVQRVTPELAARAQLPVQSGLLILGIDRRGPAFAMGIRPGDVLLEIDGVAITDADGLRQSLKNLVAKPRIVVLRGTVKQTL